MDRLRLPVGKPTKLELVINLTADSGRLASALHVMAGLVPAIHVFLCRRGRKQDVDARDKRGHDDREADSI
jgi:hypothetical protein